jgi:hypothetical protein
VLFSSFSISHMPWPSHSQLTVPSWIARIVLGGHYKGGSEAHATFSIVALHPLLGTQISYLFVYFSHSIDPIRLQ